MLAFKAPKRPRSQNLSAPVTTRLESRSYCIFPAAENNIKKKHFEGRKQCVSHTNIIRLIKYERMSCGKTAHVTPARSRGDAHTYSRRSRGEIFLHRCNGTSAASISENLRGSVFCLGRKFVADKKFSAGVKRWQSDRDLRSSLGASIAQVVPKDPA